MSAFRGKSGHAPLTLQCRLLTQSGHFVSRIAYLVPSPLDRPSIAWGDVRVDLNLDSVAIDWDTLVPKKAAEPRWLAHIQHVNLWGRLRYAITLFYVPTATLC
jgi:hypothetical protein